MARHRAWIAASFLAALVNSMAVFATQPRQISKDARPQAAERLESFVTGTVVRIYAPRLFSVRRGEPGESEGQEVLVLAPRELSTVEGAKVAVSGTMRRFDARELREVRGWSDIDPKLRAQFAGRPVLVAAAVMSTIAPEEEENEERETPEEQQTAEPARQPPQQPGPASAPLVVRASTLVDFIETFAGQHVRIQNARVVGLLTPGVFLVEPATRYLKFMGERDRLAVFIDRAQLKVPADVLVGTIIRVDGIARTMLSMQVSGDAPWPAKLSRDAVDRLEIRAAILATSVRTAEGTELTDRQAAAIKR